MQVFDKQTFCRLEYNCPDQLGKNCCFIGLQREAEKLKNYKELGKKQHMEF